MSISLKRRSLSKPVRGQAIKLFDLAFVRARNRNKAHSALLEEFAASGISRSELAKMVGKRPEQITRWLAGPGNLTLDTLSDLVFALRGHFVSWQSSDELARPRVNFRRPDWVSIDVDGISAIAAGSAGKVSLCASDHSSGAQYAVRLTTQREEHYGRYSSSDRGTEEFTVS